MISKLPSAAEPIQLKQEEEVRVLYTVESLIEVLIFPVPMRLGDTPVPIPNTTVKTQSADGTMLETAWESRWVPDHFGGVAQLGEHLPCKQGVKSSNLSISIRRKQSGLRRTTYLENHILKTISRKNHEKQIKYEKRFK